MPKAMPTIPEEDEDETLTYEAVYKQDRVKTKSDDDKLIMAVQALDITDDSCSTCSSADFVLSASTSGEDSQHEWED